MGLLDDAIREHLELKRRRGADTGEVSRQEQEALGPARRTAEPLAPAGPQPPEAREPAPPAEPEHREPAPYEHGPAPGPFVDHDLWVDEPVGPDAPLAPEHPEPDIAAPTVEFDAHDVERPAPSPSESYPPAPAPAPPPVEPPAVAPHEQGTFADEEPDIVPADEEPEGEDLLEETPEFLEETPEHDRLWFEQRPPRDFDFGS